jgi:N-acetyl-1-D-myo-inositol-2-amino-2-deoxy-alpha-D-glucopyranoside deacetylase
MRRLQPQVVITFDPLGAYGHPDHVAICQLATAAAVAAADPRLEGGTPHAIAKLYYRASAAPELAAYQEAFRTLTMTVDGVLREAAPWPGWSLSAMIDTHAHWPTVWKAVSCHESQIAAYERLKHLSTEHHAALWGRQSFYRALSTVNGGRAQETDLFEGLRESTREPARNAPRARTEEA